YKWTDANGRVVYSDQPPLGDVKIETLQGPPPPANPNAVKEMAVKDLELKKRQTDAVEKDKKADPQRAALAQNTDPRGTGQRDGALRAEAAAPQALPRRPNQPRPGQRKGRSGFRRRRPPPQGA